MSEGVVAVSGGAIIVGFYFCHITHLLLNCNELSFNCISMYQLLVVVRLSSSKICSVSVVDSIMIVCLSITAAICVYWVVSLWIGMCRIDFLFRFGFGLVFEKTRLQFGMSLVRFG